MFHLPIQMGRMHCGSYLRYADSGSGISDLIDKIESDHHVLT